MTHLRDVVNRLFVPLDDTPEEMNLIDTANTAVSDLAMAVKTACLNDHKN